MCKKGIKMSNEIMHGQEVIVHTISKGLYRFGLYSSELRLREDLDLRSLFIIYRIH